MFKDDTTLLPASLTFRDSSLRYRYKAFLHNFLLTRLRCSLPSTTGMLSIKYLPKFEFLLAHENKKSSLRRYTGEQEMLF
jgi:hypothetical protein